MNSNDLVVYLLIYIILPFSFWLFFDSIKELDFYLIDIYDYTVMKLYK